MQPPLILYAYYNTTVASVSLYLNR